ncbi:histidine phosphatase family protein [Jeotgalibacillus malaysiensis]|uniref:histidine phosphatase family protein n=1 Tax=Jeotgalibacillus malaysiensis TaxID=1508404 RepID=UPI00384BA309
MTTIYLIRHAHSHYTPDEMHRPLSEKGVKDAAAVTGCLTYENIHAVLSSPYKRAVQTVEGIAGYIGSEIEIVEGFKERTLTAQPAEDFNKAITKVWENPSFSWEGGESNLAAQQRGVKAMKHVLKEYAGQHVAIGTHGNIMVLIMQYFDPHYDFAFWRQLAMPDIYQLRFEEDLLKRVKGIGAFT